MCFFLCVVISWIDTCGYKRMRLNSLPVSIVLCCAVQEADNVLIIQNGFPPHFRTLEIKKNRFDGETGIGVV